MTARPPSGDGGTREPWWRDRRRLREALWPSVSRRETRAGVGPRLRRRLRIGFVIAVGIAVTFGMFGDGGVDHIGAYVACQDLIADQLSAPATAEYPPHHEATFSPRGDGWLITSTVTAMEPSGGQLSVHWTCTMDRADDGAWVGEVALSN